MTGTEKYKTAATTLVTDLGTHPRTAEGQFWHKQKYANQGSCDRNKTEDLMKRFFVRVVGWDIYG
jgi:hypothetical protein